MDDSQEHNLGALVTQWYKKNGRQNLPWRKSVTPYKVWISEMMLQQTQVVTAQSYYRKFLKKYPSLSSMKMASEDDIISFFNLDYENLYDLNLKSIKMVCNWLKIKMPEDIYNKKDKYDFKIHDLTHMSNCKRTSYLKQKKYNQTFETNNGFINDLSIIDLIFNCGPNSIDYF